MKSLIIVFFVLFVIVVSSKQETASFTTAKDLNDLNTRIVGGESALPGQFPWQAAIYITLDGGSTMFCGGSLIEDRWVLTAAHCTQGAREYTIFFGSVDRRKENEIGRVRVTTKEAVIHEDFNETYLYNDIALLKLKEKVTFSNRIKKIALANSTEYLGPGVQVTVSGWGKTSDVSTVTSSKLNFVNITTIPNEACKAVYGEIMVVNETLCAQGNPHHSTCNGDSGGPLIVTNSDGEVVQAGIISFVAKAGCSSYLPSGYVRTASYHDWIKTQIRNKAYSIQNIYMSTVYVLVFFELLVVQYL